MPVDREPETPVASSLRASTWSTPVVVIGVSFLVIWKTIELIDRGTTLPLPSWLLRTITGVVPGLFLLVFPLVTRRQEPPGEFRLPPARRLFIEAGLALGVAVAGLAVTLLFQYIGQYFWPGMRFETTPVHRIKSSTDLRFMYAVAAASMIYSPIAEEIFFRGFLLNAFSNRMRFNVAIVVSSLIFGIFSASNVAAAILLTLFGVGLSVVYDRRQTIISPVFVHAFYNILLASPLLVSLEPSHDSAYLGIDSNSKTGVCVVSEVRPHTPAEQAGIRVGDTLIRFDHHEIRSFQTLVDTIRQYSPGDIVSVTVERRELSYIIKKDFELTLSSRRAATKRFDAKKNSR